MYRWYENAAICYVSLYDMSDQEPEDPNNVAMDSTTKPIQFEQATTSHLTNEMDSRPDRFDLTDMEIELGTMPSENTIAPLLSSLAGNSKACEWFHRGWTLQEMLAPRELRFYNSTWTLIGTLRDLASDVAAITRVHQEAFTKQRSIYSYSIAQWMSWAANRKTTKIEDRAYSLLGLMDINMGIIYGEGSRAFQRLQDELLRTASDQSLFAFGFTSAQNPRRM